MSHAASEVRVFGWRYLHAASSECAMQCKKGTKKSWFEQRRDRDTHKDSTGGTFNSLHYFGGGIVNDFCKCHGVKFVSEKMGTLLFSSGTMHFCHEPLLIAIEWVTKKPINLP